MSGTPHPLNSLKPSKNLFQDRRIEIEINLCSRHHQERSTNILPYFENFHTNLDTSTRNTSFIFPQIFSSS